MKRLFRVFLLLFTLVGILGVSNLTKVDAGVEDGYIYFRDNWSKSKLYVHLWSGDQATSWPGKQLTTADLVEGETNVYKIYVGTCQNLLFHTNGADSDKTDDITIASKLGADNNAFEWLWDGSKVTVKAWKYVAPDLWEAPESYTGDIYFTNSKGWAAVHAYTWQETSSNSSETLNGAWPGNAMEFVCKNPQGQDVYKVSVTGAHYIIFNNGDKGKQSNDVFIAEALVDGNNAFYALTDGEKTDVGTWCYEGATINVKLAFTYEEAEFSNIRLYANFANLQFGAADAEYRFKFTSGEAEVISEAFTLAGEGKEAVAVRIPNDKIAEEVRIAIIDAEGQEVGHRTVTVQEIAQAYLDMEATEAITAALAALQAMAE